MGVRAIDRFEGDFLFLSNFYEGKVFLWQQVFHSAEHAYQWAKAHKYIPSDKLARLMSIPTPGKFKKAIKLELTDPAYGFYPKGNDEWETIKVGIMREILEKKFSNMLLRDRLERTAPAELIEGNSHHDAFWGQPLDRHGNRTKPGKNMLGKLLMEIRDGTQPATVR